MKEIESLLQQQIAYYQARASEYDEWFLRQGRYDRGPELNQAWFREVEQVRSALCRFRPSGEVLEFACGTGLWTQHLLGFARRITAVDAAPEVLKLNRERLASSKVRYVQADIFGWQPKALFDVVFFSFWLSHVPARRFEPFWGTVARSLKPGGRVFFVDSRRDPTATAHDHALGDAQGGTVVRRLNDGREFRIVKIFYAPEGLLARLGGMGWQVRVTETPRYFLYGEGKVAV
jgi:2-polyprenyl-3-methyl-5-hydroxy-6-metoxy-1,4-benzoquinol methylase